MSTAAPRDPAGRAAALDAEDPLSGFLDAFVPAPGVAAYLDGNSLGRPTRAAAESLGSFAAGEWGQRLIRGWGESWMELPLTLGDRLGEVTLGAAPGQTFIGESTTVVLYKLIHAALDARPERNEIVLDSENFPTDRFLLEGIARDRGLTLRWIGPALDGGVAVEDVRAVLGERTALVLLSHVAYRSGYLSDLPAITTLSHGAGALVLWDLCHSVGALPIGLDDAGVDLAAGCTYKYLNGGPGSPAFGYVRADLVDGLRQPIQGWMGAANVFEMAPSYAPHEGIRKFLSGTPAVVGMLAIQGMLDLIADAGMDAVRRKSVLLTEFATELSDELLAPLGVGFASPRDPRLRGSHITLTHDAFEDCLPRLWDSGVIPDFRRPNGLRLGLSPLSTSFAEVGVGVQAIRSALVDLGVTRG